jgi:hypothetical protein
MGNIVMREQWVNRTEGHLIGDSDWYEAYTDDEGELFRDLQKEYGRCTGKVYIDPVGDPVHPKEVGWVFLKKVKYDDVDKYFLRETWVDMKHRYDKETSNA